jgi:hypothetical protein
MNSNRAINDSVVEARFKENLEELAAHDRFKDFGQINLLIFAQRPSACLLCHGWTAQVATILLGKKETN